MVKKIVLGCLGMLLCIFVPLVVYLIERERYLYPVACEFNFVKWLFACCIVLVFEATVYFAIKFFKKKKPITVLLALTIVPQIIIGSFWMGMFYGTNWKSSTENVDDFGRIDSDFDRNVEICNLKLSEIMDSDPVKINVYDYNYQSKLAIIEFDVYFEIQLSQERYDYYKNIFIKDMKLQNGTENGGHLVVFEGTPTTVDKWDEMYIDYSDSTCTFCMKFKGKCYT